MSEHPDIKYLKSDDIAPVLMKGKINISFLKNDLYLMTFINLQMQVLQKRTKLRQITLLISLLNGC